MYPFFWYIHSSWKPVFMELVAICKLLLSSTVRWKTDVKNEVTTEVWEFQAPVEELSWDISDKWMIRLYGQWWLLRLRKRSSENREVPEKSACNWACHNEMPLVGAVLCSSLDIGICICALGQGFSNFEEYQPHLEGLLRHKLLSFWHWVLIQWSWSKAWECAAGPGNHTFEND